MASFLSAPHSVRLLAFGVAASVIAGPACAQAQARAAQPGDEGTEVAPIDVRGQRAPVYNADTTSSATRTDTALIDTPQAISIVTRDQIDDLSLQSMADVVRYVPGVGYAQGEGNRDALVFRGNTSTADYFTDGLRDDTQYYRDLYNIERVEILRGPNAMIFGRGGLGGLLNRVTRQAGWGLENELHIEAGSDEHFRGTVDFNLEISPKAALRILGLYQDSGSYRDGVTYERFGLNPTASFELTPSTRIQIGYEHFEDRRIADRGVPANPGGTRTNPAGPLDGYQSTFFGDPALSPTDTDVDALNLFAEHTFGNGLIVRNRTRFADYDKFYQNVFPGAVDATGTTVRISAYNNATQRQNLLSQTDVIHEANLGGLDHTLMAGFELGRQETENLRMTGYFPGGTTSVTAPLTNPTINLPITFAQSATDASNTGEATVAALYVQDQIQLTDQVQVLLGVRYDNFEVDFLNRRTGARLETSDGLWSPRLGLVFKPQDNLSFYASYSRSYLPRSGEQMTSLSATTVSLEPEQFDNYEVGAKWNITPILGLTAALYQLDRTNVVVPDPANPGQSILVDGQRSRGLELSATGRINDRWTVIAAYAWQEAEITADQSATVLAGNRLANTPEHSFSVWTRYDFTPTFGAGLGLIREGERFAAADNTQVMGAYTRIDGALFYAVNDSIDVQLNVENLMDEDYFASAHNNNNSTPGAPRSFRIGLTTRF
ncbi:MAG: TonB-dependent siderophore receptor [Caulobacterales bacterium]|nr:TonB-dependent siderophore receptor [Caulobacterales bacterium]